MNSLFFFLNLSITLALLNLALPSLYVSALQKQRNLFSFAK